MTSKSVPEIHPDAWVVSNATLIGKVKLEKNSSIWFNVASFEEILKLITIGEKNNIQDGSVLQTDPGYKLKCWQGRYSRTYGYATWMSNS